MRSALAREESRGAQWRIDFPEKSVQQGARNYVIRERGGAMAVEDVAVEPLPERLEALLSRSRFHEGTA